MREVKTVWRRHVGATRFWVSTSRQSQLVRERRALGYAVGYFVDRFLIRTESHANNVSESVHGTRHNVPTPPARRGARCASAALDRLDGALTPCRVHASSQRGPPQSGQVSTSTRNIRFITSAHEYRRRQIGADKISRYSGSGYFSQFPMNS